MKRSKAHSFLNRGTEFAALMALCALFFSLPLSLNAQPKPTISQISIDHAGNTTIKGQHFGKQCRQCEVIAVYDKKKKYKLKPLSWSPNKIQVKTPDLNSKSKRVDLYVGTANAISNKKAAVLKRKSTLSNKHRRAHTLSVGDKGEDKFPLSFKKPTCGKPSSVFDHAEISFKNKRFSDAVIVQSPESGCYRCRPIVVRWYNEPTGILEYELKIFTRDVSALCSQNLKQ